jgi:O-antigen/teichoic acid export membrane protein
VSNSLNVISLKKRLLSGGAWAFAGRVGMVVVGLVSNALLARLLSPQDLGAYFLAVSIMLFGATAGSLGLNQAVVRFIAESLGNKQFQRARRAVVLASGYGALGAFGVGLAYLLFGHLIGRDLFGAPALVSVTGLVAGGIVAMSLQQLLAEVFRGFYDIRLASLFGGLSSAIFLVTCLGLLWALEGQATLVVVMFLSAGSSFASVFLGGWLLRRKVTALPREGTEGWIRHKHILRVAWPLLITNLALLILTQADLWILGAFRSQEEVAIYGAAARVVFLLAMPLLVVNLVVMPLIAEMYAQGRRTELERTLRASATLAGIPASLTLLGFVLLGAPILGLVYGDYYRAGAVVLTLLSLGQLVNVWTGSSGITLMMTGHQFVMMAITVVCGAVTIATCLGVVGQYGSTGVAAAAAGGLALQSVSMWLGAKATTGMWTHARLSGFLINWRSAGPD